MTEKRKRTIPLPRSKKKSTPLPPETKMSPPASGRKPILPPKKKPKKKKQQKNKKPLLKQYKGRDGLPEVISVKELVNISEQQKSVLQAKVEQGKTLLFVWVREGLGIQWDRIEDPRKFLFDTLNETFADAQIERMNWPRVTRQFDRDQYSHPLVAHYTRDAISVSRKGHSANEQELCAALTYAVHEQLIHNNKTGWTVVGDETGDFSEFKPGGTGQKGLPSTMVWLAIPPNSSLPPVQDLDFHGTGDPSGVNELLRVLNGTPRCLLFSFTIDVAKQQKNAGRIGGSPYLDTWKLTLPLVLHAIHEHSGKTSEVSIYVEQVKTLQSGMGIIEPIASTAILDTELTLAECFVISKTPCEHPWMAYPDALGHLMKKKKTGLDSDLIGRTLNRMIQTPYRQSTLHNQITGLLGNRTKPLEFLKSLYTLELKDIDDYVRPFFSKTMATSLENLNEAAWQSLLREIENRSGDETGQKITSYILEQVDIKKSSEGFKQMGTMFDLAIATLGSANHMNSNAMAHLAIDLVETLLEKGYRPPVARERKYRSLRGGYRNNRFDFRHVENFASLPIGDEPPSEDMMRYLGSQSVARGLRNQGADVQEALAIEEHIRSHTQDFPSLERRYIYFAELLLSAEKPQESMDTLLELSERVDSSESDLKKKNNYFLATWLKTKFMLGDYNHVGKLSFELKHHPSERLAFWYLLAANRLNRLNDKQAMVCKSFLESLIDVPEYQSDIGAVSVLSIYHHLMADGLELNINIESHIKGLRVHSAPSTLDWLDRFFDGENLNAGVINFTSF